MEMTNRMLNHYSNVFNPNHCLLQNPTKSRSHNDEEEMNRSMIIISVNFSFRNSISIRLFSVFKTKERSNDDDVNKPDISPGKVCFLFCQLNSVEQVHCLD